MYLYLCHGLIQFLIDLFFSVLVVLLWISLPLIHQQLLSSHESCMLLFTSLLLLLFTYLRISLLLLFLGKPLRASTYLLAISLIHMPDFVFVTI